MPDRCQECDADVPSGRRWCRECLRTVARRLAADVARWLERSPVALDGRAVWSLTEVAAAMRLEAVWLLALVEAAEALIQARDELADEAIASGHPAWGYLDPAGFAALRELALWREAAR
jgi:hypothetical protein